MDGVLEYLREQLVPQVLQHCWQGRVVRIWMVEQTPAEAPYLLALLLADHLGPDAVSWSIKIFATYSQEKMVAEARHFTFSEQSLAHLPLNYQQQFFERVDAGNSDQPYSFALTGVVRHLVIFGRHDLLNHSPLSHLHLLIALHDLDSLTLPVQQVVLGRVATSLTGGGLLLLGPGASVQPHPHVYELLDPRWNLYRCRAVHPLAASNRPQQSIPALKGMDMAVAAEHLSSPQEQVVSEGVRPFPWQFDGVGMVLVNRAYRIMYLDSVAAELLGVPGEVVGQDFSKTISGLSEALLRLALVSVFEQHVPLKLSLRAQAQDAFVQRPPLTLQFAHLRAAETEPSLVAILISDARQLSLGYPTSESTKLASRSRDSSTEKLEPLQETLHQVNEQLESQMAFFQQTLEDAERVHELLQEANEELQATNEELEITSSEAAMDNQELHTITHELQVRLEEQKQASRQLELLNRLKDDFISIAGHEIKTPLTSILGNVQLALKYLSRLTLSGSEVAKEQQAIQQILQRTQQHIHRLTRLANDLLDIARIESHTLQFQFDRCELSALIRAVVEEQEQLTSGQRFVLSLPEYPMHVLADADRIRQVVNNYLSNALKYTPVGQMIEVRLQQEDQAVRLLVRDQGPGLSLPEQQRVWERYYQVPGIETQSGSEVGLGLGLAICRYIVEAHGGQVGVESVPGGGATFWFTLTLLNTTAVVT